MSIAVWSWEPSQLQSAADVVERSLDDIVARATGPTCPPRLREAITYAVFPGGARLRPLLCLGVARSCGAAHSASAQAAAAAVELVHCASLVHDDMPCFDDATMRRGRPTVHKAFDEPTALLVGDALIVMAFETLGRDGASGQLAMLAAATGPARGIIAGQAWESEPAVDLDEYHRAKTAALFEAAAGMGALSAGADPEPWQRFGELVGRAYQAADDLADALAHERDIGKTSGRDEALGRPSVVRAYGVEVARRRVKSTLAQAGDAIPRCDGRAEIGVWLERLGARLGVE